MLGAEKERVVRGTTDAGGADAGVMMVNKIFILMLIYDIMKMKKAFALAWICLWNEMR